MAYYKKEDILNYVRENLKEIEAKGLKPLNPEVEVVKKLNDEDDLLAFFWIDYIEEEDSGERVKMMGKSFYRVDHDMYTDDRFAIDLYQAMIEGVNVIDVIKKRELEKEIAKKGISNLEELEQKVKENIENNGSE